MIKFFSIFLMVPLFSKTQVYLDSLEIENLHDLPFSRIEELPSFTYHKGPSWNNPEDFLHGEDWFTYLKDYEEVLSLPLEVKLLKG